MELFKHRKLTFAQKNLQWVNKLFGGFDFFLAYLQLLFSMCLFFYRANDSSHVWLCTQTYNVW